MVTKRRFSSEEVVRRGQELYQQGIRAAVETAENIGNLVSIDIETGAFTVHGDRDDFAGTRHLRSLHPDAAICTLRIGYNAVYSFGGLLERTAP